MLAIVVGRKESSLLFILFVVVIIVVVVVLFCRCRVVVLSLLFYILGDVFYCEFLILLEQIQPAYFVTVRCDFHFNQSIVHAVISREPLISHAMNVTRGYLRIKN